MKKKTTLRLQKIINPLWKRSKVLKWPFTCEVQPKSETESKFFPRYHYYFYR